MAKFENKKFLSNLIKLEMCLIFDDNFLELSLQRKISCREMLNDIMGTLGNCMKLFLRCPGTFTQFIYILI
jgi:hypothetical protein